MHEYDMDDESKNFANMYFDITHAALIIQIDKKNIIK